VAEKVTTGLAETTDSRRQVCCVYLTNDTRGLSAQKPQIGTGPGGQKGSQDYLYLHCVPEKTPTYVFVNDSVKNQWLNQGIKGLPISTLCPRKKTSTYIFVNNLAKNQRIVIIFGAQNSDEIWHKCQQNCPLHLNNVTTLPCETQISHIQH